jgi:hypothetical protein
MNGMPWERVHRGMREMEERQRTAQTEEQCQAVGNLGRDVAISLGQAVYDPERHGDTDSHGTKIGRDDAKRMLDAYIDATLPGAGNAEFRAFAKSAVQQATALSHKRTATVQHAQLAVAAMDSLVRIVEILANRQRTDPDWAYVEVDGRCFAWDGPLHRLEERRPTVSLRSVEEALRSVGMIPAYGERAKLREHIAKGSFQVYETDRRTWIKELLYADDGRQVLLAKPQHRR